MKKLLAVVLMSLATAVAAQTFPNKPVKIITSLPVGSGPDVISRKLADRLTEKWKVPVLVENRPGGAGAVAFGTYADAPADGYTILSGDAGNFVGYPILYNKPDALSTIEPLTSQNMASMMLVVSPKVKDFADLKTKYAKNPVFASGGNGSPMHLEGLELSSFWKINGTHVPYKEIGAMWVDTANELVPFTFATIGSSQQLEAGGKLKYLAYTSESRHPDYPNVPTLNELTGQNRNFIRAWVVFYIKKAAPADVKAKLVKDISEVMQTTEMQTMLKTMAYQYPPAKSADLQKFIDGQTVEFKKTVKQHNVSIQ